MMETYYGYVRTPADAIKLFEACRLGQLPRVQRRLSEKERGSIRSGSVFVWDEREAGMRRWTDGKSWSASRVSGSFLTYREMEGKRGNGFSNRKRGNSKTPDSGRGSDEDRDRDDGEPDGYRYKADGLMKQSFSITTSSGQHLHLISYYARGQQDLPQPSTDPSLRLIVPVKGMYPESSLHDTPVPAMTRSPMQQPFSHVNPQHAAAGLPPHHYAQYPTAGHQPGYNHGWPPSPVATPPYSHPPYTSAPSYSQPTLPLPLPHPAPHSTYGHQLPLQHQPYPPSAPASSMYERTPLPPPQSSALMQPRNTMSLPQPYPPSTVSPRPTISHTSPLPHHASPLGSPRTQHLQAQAMEAGLIDPELGINGHRGGHLALPPMSQPGQSGTIVTASPPTRTLSPPSPPRSSHSEAAANGISAPLAGGSNKVSLSSIINHPTPANPEPGSANARGGNSAHSSPRAPAGPQANGTTNISTGPTDADRQAIGALNKNFCV